jgi:taurine dioxygenase
LRAVYSSRHVFGVKSHQANPERRERLVNPDQAAQDAVHPVVIRHPDTGRPTLYVNATFTTHFEGWTERESKPLLDFLYQHAARPEFQTRFKWEEGSIAFWDNRATWHYALNDYQGERRLMHRITIEGVPLEPAH